MWVGVCDAPPETVVFTWVKDVLKPFCLFQRLHFDQERLEQTNRQLEEEVGRLKVNSHFMYGSGNKRLMQGPRQLHNRSEKLTKKLNMIKAEKT